MAILGRLLS